MHGRQSDLPFPSRRPTLLATSCAVIKNVNNRASSAIRLLIDQGSELSFIKEEIVKRLNLVRSAASVPLVGIGGTYSGRTRGATSFQLQSIHDEACFRTINAFILPQLTTKLPSIDTVCRS